MLPSLPLGSDLDCTHKIEEHLAVARLIGHHGQMHVHPVSLTDEVAGEVELLHRPSTHFRHPKGGDELQKLEAVSLEAAHQARVGQHGARVPPVILAAHLGGEARPRPQ